MLDSVGNVEGGIRTPYVDVPVAMLSGEGQERVPGSFCHLAGTTELLSATTLAELYEDNDAYIEAVNASTDDAVSEGFLLAEDGALIKAYAAGSDIFSED